MAEHKSDLQRGAHGNEFMQRVYNKYADEFEFVVLEKVEGDLKAREQEYLDDSFNLNECMNLNPIAHRPHNPWTEESRAKMSKTCTGRKHSPETLKKLSEAKKGKIGGVHSKPVKFIWNDREYGFVSMMDFLNTFDASARCIYRRLTKNAGSWITLTHIKPDSKHPFSNGDKLYLSWNCDC